MSQRVLITGASSGIGLQLARDYSADGWQVIPCSRNAERLKSLGTSQTLEFDIANREQTLSAAKTLNATIDVLILNAGNCEYIDDPIHFDSQLFKRVFDANVIGMAHCLEAFLPRLAPQGRVALMGSAATHLPFSRAQAYGSSKAAVAYLARSLQVDLYPRGITVSLIQPGFVDTPLTAKNSFDMPGIISTEQASKDIRRGIEKRRSTIATPRVFNTILGLLGALPEPLPSWIAARMRQT